MARTLGRPRLSKAKKPEGPGRYVIVIDRLTPKGKSVAEFFEEEDDTVCRFRTREDALALGRMADWSSLPWYVVELVDGGEVVHGTGR